MLRALYREPSGVNTGFLYNVADCKCSSPNPDTDYADCYMQDVSTSFDGS